MYIILKERGNMSEKSIVILIKNNQILLDFV